MQPPDVDGQQHQGQKGATGRQLGEIVIESGRTLPVHAIQQTLKPGTNVNYIQTGKNRKTDEGLGRRKRQLIRWLVKRDDQQGDDEI